MGPCRFWGLLLVLLGVGIAASLWAAAMVLPLAQRMLLGGLFAAWLGWVALRFLRPARGRLTWQRLVALDGGHWAWHEAEAVGSEGLAPVSLYLVIDLQQRLLLRLQGPAGVPRWVWVEQGRAPDDWLALRRAVVAHAASERSA